MRRPRAGWWYANGKTASWRSVTVAGDCATRRSRRVRLSNRRPPERDSRDGCRRRRRRTIRGEKVIDRCRHEGGQRREKKSCGNGGVVESVEIQKQDFPSSHRSLEISQKPRDSHIPTAPATRRWKSGKPKAGFPLSHRLLLGWRKKPKAADCVGEEKGATSIEVRKGTFLTRLDRPSAGNCSGLPFGVIFTTPMLSLGLAATMRSSIPMRKPVT